MNEGTRNQLEAKLKKMLNQFDEAEARKKQTVPPPGKGNVIRRRKGEKDKRFSHRLESGLVGAAPGKGVMENYG